jgi:predicted nuclease of predicted toxin-antitoxin system
MKFLADMGVSWRVVEWLRSNGHDATHLADLGLERFSDPKIFAMAAAEQRVLITFDLDFGEIAARSGRIQPSVIVFRLANARPTNVIARLNVALVDARSAIDRGAIILVEQTRIRIRRLPIGIDPAE